MGGINFLIKQLHYMKHLTKENRYFAPYSFLQQNLGTDRALSTPKHNNLKELKGEAIKTGKIFCL